MSLATLLAPSGGGGGPSHLNSTRLWSANDSLRLAAAARILLPNNTASINNASAAGASSSSGPSLPIIDPARAAESNTAQLLAILTTVHIFALLWLLLRLYVRVLVVKAPGRDDVCIVLSAICATGGWVVFLIQSRHGLGKHEETISRADMVTFMHAGFWQSVISATFALAFLKLSIGFNLLRLSISKWYTRSLWATIVVVICYSIMGAMTFFFHCKPMAGHWDFSLKPKCYSMSMFVTFGLVNTSFNITTDVLFATFPIFVIWPLRMRRKLRVYLVCILSLGYFAVAMGILKAVYQNASPRESDRTFRQRVTFWGFLQLNVGIIAACAATLKPLVNRVSTITSGTFSTYLDSKGNRKTWFRHHSRKSSSISKRHGHYRGGSTATTTTPLNNSNAPSTERILPPGYTHVAPHTESETETDSIALGMGMATGMGLGKHQRGASETSFFYDDTDDEDERERVRLPPPVAWIEQLQGKWKSAHSRSHSHA